MQPLGKSVWKLIKKLKIELLHVPAISLLGIYQKNWKHDLRDICTPMFTAVLFTIVKKWKQLNAYQINGYRKCEVYTVEYYSTLKKKKKGNFAIYYSMNEPWGHCVKWH